MKVLLVIKTAEGGLWILAHIAALRARGHETIVILPTGDGRLRRALDDASVRVVPTTFDFRFAPRPATVAGLLRLRRQVKALEPDVLHYHLYASALAVRLATFGMRLPSAYMVAGPLYLESPLIRSVERWLMRLDTVLIAGSDHTAELYRALGRGQGVVTIPYGVDTEYFAPLPRQARSRTRAALGIPESAFVAIMVAYVYAPKVRVHAGVGIKGHEPLLTGWQEFHRHHTDSRLVLVGGGFDEAGTAHRDGSSASRIPVRE
jgi:glycosyltransferase involved in cell wall biosynthesis